MPSQPEAIVTASKILRLFFGGVHMPLYSHDNGRNWTLNSEKSYGETDDEKHNHYTLFLFPIRDDLSKSATYSPFFISLTITLKVNEQIEKLSLKIFKEDQTRVKTTNMIPTELILRVEWDNEAAKNPKVIKHAQPHWHIHSYKNIDIFENRQSSERQTILALLKENETKTILTPLMQELEGKAIDESTITQRITLSEKEIPLYRFHLAMLAEWDRSSNTLCNKILNEENLKVWLPQCLNYIKDQLEYILEKIGKHEPTNIQPADCPE